MDESTKLISDLNCKLAQLDMRVWRYRRDMTTEFNRYATDALRDAPDDVVRTVSQSIAEGAKVYTSLAAQSENPSLPLLSVQAPPPFPEQDSPPAAHDREHDREHDFQGLFTPSYLPLLDGTSRERYSRERYSPLRPTHNGSEDRARSEETMDRPTAEGSENNRPAYNTSEEDMEDRSSTRSLTGSDAPRPPRPVRRSTDETSMSSDVSGGQVRRSALRRSSSATRTPRTQSPRRVRFDFMGEEVLPTSSPVRGEGEMMEVGLLDADSPPRKKKMSSTQALRALSRMSSDEDEGQGTTMGSDADGKAIELEPGQSGVEYEAKEENSDDEDLPSDDDMAGMPALTPMRGQRPTAFSPPPSVAADDDEPPSPGSPVRPAKRFLSLDNPEQGLGSDEEDQFEHDEQDLFRFDESGHEERTQLDDESDSDPGLEMPLHRISPADPELSRSPAVSIPSRPAPAPAPAAPVATPSQAPIGSYKGSSFSMPIVSAELHAQAASMGDVFSLVGSIKDITNEQSFRESLRDGAFTGTPRSLMERMMMEDMAEAEEKKAEEAEAQKAKLGGEKRG